MNYHAALLACVFNIQVFSSFGAVDDAVSHRSEDLLALKNIQPSPEKSNKGGWLPVPIPIANPTLVMESWGPGITGYSL